MKLRKYILYGVFLFCFTNIFYIIFDGIFRGDNDKDISGFVDIHKQSISHGRTQIEVMSARVANYCKLFEGNERFTKKSPFVESSYNLYNRSRTCACDVPKAASTSIKRALLILEYPEKTELFKNIPGHALHTRKEVKNVTSDECFRNSATSFLVTRDPYTRLYSAYIDKIYLVKFHKLSVVLDAIHNKGLSNKKVKEMIKKEDKRLQRLFCGMPDVSFEQFLKHVALTARLDIHYSPVSLLCKPCSNHFDIILKLETLKEDSQHLFKTIYNFQNSTEATFPMQDYIGEAGIESQIVTYYTHWNSWISTHRCEDDKIPYDAINRRLWNGLKMVGSIDENLEFVEELFRGPTREKYKLRKPETVLYEFKANKIPYLDSESRERQRIKFLKQAYENVDKEVIKGIQKLFQFDFILFDYDPLPPS